MRWVRDGVFLCLVLYTVQWWQTKGMLPTNGETNIVPITLPTLSGNTHTIAPVASKRTLVYFFAPWCQICRVSIGNLDYVDRGEYRVVRIALDYNNPAEVEEFMERADVKGRVYLGTEQTREIFQVTGYPTYYLLDENFTVIDKSLGYSSAIGLKLRTWLATPPSDTE
ncbi:TlpA family protein disulfide reductase [Alteromonas aestuariivivens]|uniref:TlpA family protein disulfide reductase n=2 Tax=Alteromonas aestuariivivens TaxID=1938339 RepID=A0A3D8M8J7_9ALTE|nr:TlpA family protein disulfide reductase [Alteromonas aestuariivivens]